jgi:hypothetical protein
MQQEEQSSSAFRFEKRRVEATISLVGGDTVQGSFFVAAESVSALLEQDTGFFPFEIGTGDGAQTVLYNRAHVIWMMLSDARRLRGVVRVYRPEGRDRLSDWTRQPETFRYVDTDEGPLLVNAAHIVAITEEPLE